MVPASLLCSGIVLAPSQAESLTASPQLAFGRKAGCLDAEMLCTQLLHCVQLATVTRRKPAHSMCRVPRPFQSVGVLAHACHPTQEASLG